MAAVASPFRTPDFISPSARRRRAIVLTSTNTPTNHLAENDDAAERRQRRLSKATSATLQSPATPRSASRVDSERYSFIFLLLLKKLHKRATKGRTNIKSLRVFEVSPLKG